MTVSLDIQANARAATTKTVATPPDDKLNAGRTLLAASGMNEAALAAIMTAADVVDSYKRK